MTFTNINGVVTIFHGNAPQVLETVFRAKDVISLENGIQNGANAEYDQLIIKLVNGENIYLNDTNRDGSTNDLFQELKLIIV